MKANVARRIYSINLYAGPLNGLLNTYKNLISDFKMYYDQRLYANKRLRQLFIDKLSEESEYTDAFSEVRDEIEAVKKYFAPVIVELWDKDNIDEAGSIFKKLTEEYTDDPYFFAHTIMV